MYQSAEIKLNLNWEQLRKLYYGETVQISNQNIGNGQYISMKLSRAKKIDKAFNLGKGCRIQLSHDEVNLNKCMNQFRPIFSII